MPSSKVIVHFAVGAILGVAGYLAKDTSWIGWVPSSLTWAVPIVLQLLAAVAAYAKAENRPAPSAVAAIQSK